MYSTESSTILGTGITGMEGKVRGEEKRGEERRGEERRKGRISFMH